MSFLSRIISLAISLSLLFLIFNLVRKRQLKEKYALLWLLTGFAIMILAIFPDLLKWLTYTLGTAIPINAVFFLGIFFIVLINIHFSVVISNLSEQNKKITQKLALLETELKNIIHRQ